MVVQLCHPKNGAFMKALDSIWEIPIRMSHATEQVEVKQVDSANEFLCLATFFPVLRLNLCWLTGYTIQDEDPDLSVP